MINRFCCTLVCLFFSISASFSQQGFKSDTLFIYDSGQKKMEISWRSRTIPLRSDSLSNEQHYSRLISSFKAHLEQILPAVPRYDHFELVYDQGTSLTVNEIKDAIRYIVDQEGNISTYSEHVARLKNQSLKINIFFRSIDELLEDDHLSIVRKSISDLNLFKLRGRNIKYSLTDQIQIEDKKSLNFFIGPLGSVGILENINVFEYGLNLGIAIGPKQQKIALQISRAFARTYLSSGAVHPQTGASLETVVLRENNINQTIIGVHYKPHRHYSFQIDRVINHDWFRLKNRLIHSNGIRLGVTVFPRRHLSLTPILMISNYTEGIRTTSAGINLGYTGI